MAAKKPVAPFGDDAHPRIWNPSALRALTSSPRLSLSRSRRDSCSTTSSSSTTSLDPGLKASCVTRQTPHDECAVHRFIVWAAIQRNACEKMSPSEKLECPLLRCRKRFPNHELMLKHLYVCDLLSTGEYWCYECEKPEKFTDGKCKRCLGHPGKRRKMLKIAKNFFSTIGHKSRKDDVPDLDLVAAINVPPPSYDSLHVRPQQVELSCATEIVEIDSIEIPVTPAAQPPSHPQASASTQILPRADRPRQATGLDAMISSMPSPLSEWDFNLITSGHGISTMDHGHVRVPERPALQLTTYDLAHYRQRLDMQKKGKKLSPSSSLRSNASSGSHGISPISAFSGAWTVGSGFDTDLTSPTSDGGGFLSRGGSNASRRSCFDGVQLHETISELPADYPVPDTLPPVVPDDFHARCPLVDSLAALPGLSSAPLASGTLSEPNVETSEISKPQSLTNTDALVASAWDTLQAHIASSMQKLRHMSYNPLVNQLQFLEPDAVAKSGLATLKAILEGQAPTSPLDWICFVHVTYSLSLVIYERDAESMSKRLFAQAYVYGDQVPPEFRDSYLEVATTIWQPLDMSEDELASLLVGKDLGILPTATISKGKGRAMSILTPHGTDELLEIARFFLDELEYAALPANAPRSIATLDLDIWTQQMQDAYTKTGSDRVFPVTVGLVVNMLQAQFPNAFGLAKKLGKFQKRIDVGEIQSPRRAELELIQAGKGHLSTNVYFDSYVAAVRQHCDNIYKPTTAGLTPRTTYHLCGVELMKAMMSNLYHNSVMSQHGNSANDGPFDDIFKLLTTGFEDDPLNDLLGIDDLNGVIPMDDVEPTIDGNMLLDPMAAVFGGNNSIGPSVLHHSEDVSRTVLQAEPPANAQQDPVNDPGAKVDSPDCCDICGFRPKGHPKWFKGTLTKHKRLQHKTTPPTIYRCPFPGCTSQYKNRPDNLRQHQLDKSHFIDGEGVRRPSKRKKVDEPDDRGLGFVGC